MKRTAAVVGCGDVSTVHFEAIDDLDDIELVAVCDTDPAAAAAAGERYGVPAFPDHRAMLAQVRPDVVHVCTPHHEHVQVVIDCLAAGVNVLLELGRPTHVFDLDKIHGGLEVRWAREGESITTLDDVERRLTTGDGVIADAFDVPLGIAGVMGGASTEISGDTTAVLLEMAWWDPMTIARSSRRLGLRSEASMRLATARARTTPPTSGETTIRSAPLYRALMSDAMSGAA